MWTQVDLTAVLQAGARHVYGIERSAIAEQAIQIIADNKYSDKITIIQGKVEEVELPVPKVPSSSRSPLQSPQSSSDGPSSPKQEDFAGRHHHFGVDGVSLPCHL